MNLVYINRLANISKKGSQSYSHTPLVHVRTCNGLVISSMFSQPYI